MTLDEIRQFERTGSKIPRYTDQEGAGRLAARAGLAVIKACGR